MSRDFQSAPADSQVAERHAEPARRSHQLLGTPAVCQRLGISRWTWHRWVVSRRAPAPVPNIPGQPRWSVEAIEDFERGRFGASGRVYFGARGR